MRDLLSPLCSKPFRQPCSHRIQYAQLLIHSLHCVIILYSSVLIVKLYDSYILFKYVRLGIQKIYFYIFKEFRCSNESIHAMPHNLQKTFLWNFCFYCDLHLLTKPFKCTVGRTYQKYSNF